MHRSCTVRTPSVYPRTLIPSDIGAAMMPQEHTTAVEEILAGGGMMGRLMRTYDWSITALGTIASWPQSLQTALSIVLNAPHPMVIIWGDDHLLFYNDAYQQILEKAQRPTGLAQRGQEVWPALWEEIVPDIERVVATGQPLPNQEVRVLLEHNGSGRVVCLSWSYSALRDEMGTVGGIVGSVIETPQLALKDPAIFQRDRAALQTTMQRLRQEEEALHQREETIAALNRDLQHRVNELETLFNVIPICVAIAQDPDCHQIRINPFFAKLLNFPVAADTPVILQERAADFPFKVLRNGRELPEEQRPLQYVSGQGVEMRDLEIDIVRGDGALFNLFGHAAPLLDEQGNPRGAVSAYLDVTHLKRTEEALREALQRNSTILDSISDAFVALNHEWRYTYVNREAVRLLRKTPNELLGREIWEIFPTILNTPIEQHLRQAMVEQVAIAYEHLYAPYDTWFEVHVYPSSDGLSLYFQDITERKQAEMALHKSETLLNAILASSPIGLAFLDPDLRYVHANEALARMNGLPLSAHINHTLAEVLPDWAPQLEPILHQVMATQEPLLNQELQGQVSSSGRYQYCLVNYYPVCLPDGQVLGVGVTAIDVTEQRLNEQERARLMRELQEASALLDTLFNNAPVGIGMWDEQLRYVRLNDALAEINGLPQDAHLGKTVAELLPGIDASVMQAFRHVVETGESLVAQEASGETPAAPGKQRYWSVSYYPIQLPGDVTWIGAICEEITERKQTEAARQLLAEASAALVSSLDTQGMLTNISQLIVPMLADCCFFDLVTDNGRLQRLGWWHKDPDQRELASQVQRFATAPERTEHPTIQALTSGKPVFIPQVTDAWLQQIATSEEHLQLMRSGNICSQITVPLVARDRKLGALNLFLTAESGRRYTTDDLLLAEELTYRIALGLDNAQLYQQAQEANRIKDEFLAVLSHELRSPLNPILGWATLLRTRTFDSVTTDKALETIERNARLQTQLIDDLLDVSRILRGKMALKTAPVNLAPTIEAALETVRLSAEAKGIQIQTQLDPQVGQVSGDAGRLQQIVWNLLSNAIKFTPAGGTVEIRLEQVERDGVREWGSDGVGEYPPPSHHPGPPARIGPCAQITVSDTGKGISPEFLPHVFEYFRQADSTTTRQFGGLGLGLAIVRYLTELHGGSVHAGSPGEEQGATFTIRLPLLKQPEAHELSPENYPLRTQHLALSTPFTGLRVLVVDDEADVRELLTIVLEPLGAEVRAAASASEALVLLSQFQPDILLSDIGMPGMDGYMLLRQVRRRPADQGGRIPAIALTAYAGEADQQRALAAGFQQHVPKPVEPAILISAIAALVNR